MIFKQKYNNSLGIMCSANKEMFTLISDYLMDLPEDVIEKIKNKNNFDVLREDVDVWYADVFEYAALQSVIDNKTTLLRIYPIQEENIKEMEIIYGEDVAAMIYDSYELAQIQYFKEGDEKVISYSSYLVKCKDGYQILLLKASSPVEEMFDPDEYNIEDYSETFISEKELMNIIDNYKPNKSR
jgi:hypothetical protein